MPPPAALVYCTLRKVGADLRRVEVVIARDRNQRVGGKQLGDEPPERGIEGGAAAGRVGEERAAPGVEMTAAGRRDLPWETTATRGRGCRSRDNRPGWDRGRTGLSGRCTTFKLYGGLRRASIKFGMA